jgi:hypothetical protein
VRADAYASLGIATLCRTNLMADAVNSFLGMPMRHLPGIQEPTGSHPGGEHHEESHAGASGPAAAPASSAVQVSSAIPASAGQEG